MKKAQSGEIIIYQSEEGKTKIEVRLENDNVWLTQKMMAELFQTTPQNITIHLKNIFEEGELQEDATCKDFLQVQTEIDELFALLETDLRKGIRLFPADNISFDAMQASSYLFYSNAVPKAILAKMYMYLGEYEKAYPLLRQIIQSGNYTLSNSRTNALSSGSKEIIYAFRQDSWADEYFSDDNHKEIIYAFRQDPQSEYSRYIESTDIVPALLYSEVVMLAAECAYRLGYNDEAVNYYNKVAESRGAATISSTTDFMSAMLSLWENELKGTGTYFAFLKRNNLAEEVLNIPAYKQLLPIPQREVDVDPNIMQNPGY